MVAGAALTAALALGALPGIAGSAGPTPASAVDPAAFQSVQVPAFASTEASVEGLDSAYAAAARLAGPAAFTQAGRAPRVNAPKRPDVTLPAAPMGSALKPPRYKLSGYATFYANGTTAMRLPRGTTIIVCGAGGCLERVVSDYGPVASYRNRVIDLYTPDFFDICGCPSWSGTTWVTVSIY
jgi:hypothetical protein